MTDPRPENDLELAIRLARSGEWAVEQLAPALLGFELVVLTEGTPEPTAVNPLVVHRGGSSFLAAFTAVDRVPAEFGQNRSALMMPGRILVGGAGSGVGLAVNPGSADAMEIPASALAALRSFSSAPEERYFIREGVIDGQSVPISVFRRRVTPEGPVDERLLDVDSWTDDTPHTVDKAVRFPLDSDLEEISPDAAQDVFDMVSRRSYTPLRRR
ncbi:SseB family protein [Microbacterium enclense]|uniref:SseB protein N-terminal domain-containing protein n=1 Tax=Microbacterium enclense TaxID=993073 RepID=A0A1G6RVS6_9MICO|nr:SseB family protein [Microbacterium enclense]KSU51177.1 hypothetical protein AS029_16725 [Microbacterium enclense]SDD08553.1 SseB protein N-terminal domain-containing protein [Microbacterium enclense]